MSYDRDRRRGVHRCVLRYKELGFHMYRCVMRTRHAVCGNKWLHCESIGVISYVRMRIWFVVRIRMRQTESVHVAIQNVSAHESDKKFQQVTSLSRRVFPIKKKTVERY